MNTEIKINQIFVDVYNQGYRYMLYKNIVYPLVYDIMKVFTVFSILNNLEIVLKDRRILFGKTFFLDLLTDIPNKKGLKVLRKIS